MMLWIILESEKYQPISKFKQPSTPTKAPSLPMTWQQVMQLLTLLWCSWTQQKILSRLTPLLRVYSRTSGHRTQITQLLLSTVSTKNIKLKECKMRPISRKCQLMNLMVLVEKVLSSQLTISQQEGGTYSSRLSTTNGVNLTYTSVS